MFSIPRPLWALESVQTSHFTLGILLSPLDHNMFLHRVSNWLMQYSRGRGEEIEKGGDNVVIDDHDPSTKGHRKCFPSL